MSAAPPQTIPARSGVAVPLTASSTIRVINTHGTQVIDFWAFPSPLHPLPCPTYLSMPHTRAATLRISPLVGDTLYTNLRTPLLRLDADTTSCIHDTLIPACDPQRYAQLGVPDHASCAVNLRRALASLDPPFVPPEGWPTPSPLNLFMNIPLMPPSGGALAPGNASAGGSLSFESPVCEKGGSVVFTALADCVVVMSACPQDLVPVNGKDMAPTEAHFVVGGPV